MIPRWRAGRRFGIGMLAALLVLTGCAAGQHAPTSEQTPVIDGVDGHIGSIGLGNLSLAAPNGLSWDAGSSVPLRGQIINTGTVNDQLVKVTTDAASSVTLGSAAAATSPTASPTAGGSSSGAVDLPAGERVDLSSGRAGVTLDGLSDQLFPAQSIQMTFTFAKAGSVTLRVAVHLTATVATAPTLPTTPAVPSD